ncbi:MAG: hypothetical protein HFH60_02930 [Lachnospiraceae bacterium]|nr:hypothetical protein [Lachnospiraceae bacterium]
MAAFYQWDAVFFELLFGEKYSLHLMKLPGNADNKLTEIIKFGASGQFLRIDGF